MKLALLLPQASGAARTFYSGGDLYDLQLATALERRGHTVDVWRTPRALDPRRWAARLLAGGYAAVLQDELGHAEYRALNRQLRRRLPAIALVHVTRARLEPEARSSAVERAYLRGVDATLFPSRQVRRETERLLDLRLPARIAHPGCDHLPVIPPRTAAGSKARHFVSVGHFLPNKGHLELVEAFAAIGGRHRLSLIGDPARDRGYAARVRKAAQRAGASVRLLGPLAPVALARALARADVFATASVYESYGIAAAEALRAGLPCVAWARGGLWEFLTPGENALRVRPGDRAGLAGALARLAREPALFSRLSRGARRSGALLPRWDDAAARLERLLPREAHAAA